MAKETPNRIVLDNFNTMTPWVRTFTPKSQFYSLTTNGLGPDYTTQDNLQYAPLYACQAIYPTYALQASGNIIQMITDPTANNDLFALSLDGNVYKVAFTTLGGGGKLLGTIPNVGSSGYEQRITYYNGYVVATGAGPSGNGFSYINPSGGSWTTVDTGPSGRTSTAVFLNNLYVGGTTDYRVWQINSQWGTTYNPPSALALPTSLGVIDLENYNNKYLAVAAGPTGTQDWAFQQNYIFLWDGISNKYNYSIEAPGRIISMRDVNGTLFVAIADTSSSSTIYYLSGLTLKKLFNTAQAFTVANALNSSGVKTTTKPLFNMMGNLGIVGGDGNIYVYRLDNKELFSFGNPLGNYAMSVQNIALTSAINTNPPTPKIFVSFNTFVYLVVNNLYSNSSFTTNSIDLNGTITSIEVYYDSPPVSGADSIYTTIYYEDENKASGTQFNNAVFFQTINPTNYMNDKYTILDGQSIVCRKMALQISTHCSSGWTPIIRKVVINYEPIK